jgi:hypothetical protein
MGNVSVVEQETYDETSVVDNAEDTNAEAS